MRLVRLVTSPTYPRLAQGADPTTVRYGCHDAVVSPGARSWSTESAVDLMTVTRAYLRLLDRHDNPSVELQTSSPGITTYEDNVQLVAVPLRYPEDWPFDPF